MAQDQLATRDESPNGVALHWKLEIIDTSGAKQESQYWHWDLATDAFQEARSQDHVQRATVSAVQRNGTEISTWNFVRKP